MKLSIATYLRGIGLIVCTSAVLAHADSPTDLNVVPLANAVVEQPRPFGYAIGDVLTQRVLLELNGTAFEPAALPRSERINAWLERRAPRIESAPDAKRWLVVDYQLINAPQALTLTRIPAWELKSQSGAGPLKIAEWPISISPLTPRSAFGKGALEELRPDRPAPLIATAPIRDRILICSVALALTLATWLAWLLWRNWRASVTQPFAVAQREIRRLDPAAPEAWQALHRAFDRSAGRVVQTTTLPALFEQLPHLVPLRPSIERFFEQSSARFFGAGLPPDALSVRELSLRLRRVEKANET